MSSSAATAPAVTSAARSLWSQPWLLPLTAVLLVATDALPRELKALGLLAVVALFALALRARGAARPAGRTASGPARGDGRRGAMEQRWAANRAALFQLGDALIRRTLQQGQPVSVIVFEQADLVELHALFGHAAAQEMARDIDTRLGLLARGRGLAVRTGPTVWALVLPGADPSAACEAVREALDGQFAIEAESRGEEIVLVPDFLVQPVADGSARLQAVYADMRARIRQANEHEMRRQDYLRRERESYTSRPMPLPANVRRRQPQAAEALG